MDGEKTKMNDVIAELVHKMKDGNETAFDSLYRIYVNKLYSAAYLISGSRADSEDIVQETFVKCFLRKDSVRNEAAFEGWLYRILVRTAWRYMKRRPKDYSYDALTEDNEEHFSGEWVQIDKETLQPLEEVLLNEERERIREAVSGLEIRQRTVIVLYYYNGLSVRDIARITGSMEGTVKSRLYKGRENLRASLEKENFEAKRRREYETV